MVEADGSLVSGGGFYIEGVGVGADFLGDGLDGVCADSLILVGWFDEEVFDPVGFAAAISQMDEAYRGVVQADEPEAVAFGGPGVQVFECFRIVLLVVVMDFPEVFD